MPTLRALSLACMVLTTLLSSARGQEVQIGLFDEVYQSLTNRLPRFVSTYLDVYLYVDEPVEAVAYQLDLSPVGSIAFLSASYGPSGSGSAVIDGSDVMVDLGECAVPQNGRILVARLEAFAFELYYGYDFIRLQGHADLPSQWPSYRPCGGSWVEVDRSLASMVESAIRILQPAPGDVVEAGSLSPYVFIDTIPILIARLHEVSVDGGMTWMPAEYTDCVYEGIASCQWILPSVPTAHARVRISLGEPGPPDPGHPELEFTITGDVAAAAESWSAVKARY